MTPRLTNIMETAGGSFYHFGVVNAMASKLCRSSSSLVDVDTLTLHINIDWLRLFGNSTVNMWPI